MARILSLPNYLPRTCSILIIRKPEKYEKKKLLYLKEAKNKTRKKKNEKKESKKDKNRAIFSGRRNLLIIQNHC